jgi:hypothetical protein
VHPLQGDELRALRRLQREQQPSSHVFTTERGGPMTPKGFNTLFRRVGERASLLPAHAAPRLRLCLGQCRPRHAGAAGLARPQEHSAHGALYRVGARSFRGLLEDLTMAKPWKTDLFATAEDDIRQFGAAMFGLFRAAPRAMAKRVATPTRRNFAHRIDRWDSSGENIVEHLAEIEDYELAMATRSAKGTPVAPAVAASGWV